MTLRLTPTAEPAPESKFSVTESWHCHARSSRRAAAEHLKSDFRPSISPRTSSSKSLVPLAGWAFSAVKQAQPERRRKARVPGGYSAESDAKSLSASARLPA